jgi:hypothetical protein
LSSLKPIASKDAALIAPQKSVALDGTSGDWNRPPISIANKKGQAISWQAMPYTMDTHGCSNERDYYP